MRLSGRIPAVLLFISAVSAFGQAPANRGGKSESVKVHGHWVLEIKNPDGSLASRHEIENSLSSGGMTALANFLTGQAVFGGWAVAFPIDGCVSPGCGYLALATSASVCSGLPVLVIGAPPPTCAPSLTYSVAGGGYQVVLQGVSPPAPSSGGLSI